MGSYTDEEINNQNRQINYIQEIVDSIWEDILAFAFDAKHSKAEQMYRELQNLETEIGYLKENVQDLKWEPYDTPQTAVDCIGQKE